MEPVSFMRRTYWPLAVDWSDWCQYCQICKINYRQIKIQKMPFTAKIINEKKRHKTPKKNNIITLNYKISTSTTICSLFIINIKL